MDHDDILIEQCKTGDQKALVALYRKYYHQVYNTCLRIVCIPADAEDLMQNSFLDAYKRLRSYRGPSAFGGWIKKIAVNNAIDFVSKRKIKGEPLEMAEDVPDLSADDEALIEFRVDQVKKAMNRVITDYRIILSLYLFEGYDQEEIGQILGLSPSNVRTRLSRARQSLLIQIGRIQEKPLCTDLTNKSERNLK